VVLSVYVSAFIPGFGRVFYFEDVGWAERSEAQQGGDLLGFA
jgi:hypothetical protein